MKSARKNRAMLKDEPYSSWLTKEYLSSLSKKEYENLIYDLFETTGETAKSLGAFLGITEGKVSAIITKTRRASLKQKKADITDDRKILVLNQSKVKNGTHWAPKDFTDLHKGDVFKIYDGETRYTDLNTGDNVWMASSEPFQSEGHWAVDCYN